MSNAMEGVIILGGVVALVLFLYFAVDTGEDSFDTMF